MVLAHPLTCFCGYSVKLRIRRWDQARDRSRSTWSVTTIHKLWQVGITNLGKRSSYISNVSINYRNNGYKPLPTLGYNTARVENNTIGGRHALDNESVRVGYYTVAAVIPSIDSFSTPWAPFCPNLSREPPWQPVGSISRPYTHETFHPRHPEGSNISPEICIMYLSKGFSLAA